MHIVLLILKVIGVILLVLLGLLITLTAAVLFVPLRYKLEAEKEGRGPDRLFCQGCISWLFHLLALHACRDEQLTSVFLKVGPFRVKTFYENRKPVRKAAETSEHFTQEEDDAFSEAMQEAVAEALAPDIPSEVTEVSDEEGALLLADEQKPEEHTVEKSEHTTEKTAEKTAVKSAEKAEKPSHNVRPERRPERAEEAEYAGGKRSTGRISHIDGSKFKSLFGKVKQALLRLQLFLIGLPDLIFDVLFRIGEGLDKAEETVETLYDKVESLRDKFALFTDAGSTAAYRHILRELKAFAHHCRVRRLDGSVRLGTGSADTTGEAVGVIYTILPAASRLVLEPDFYEKVLEGKIIAAGRVRLIHSAVAAVKLLLDKNVRRLLGKLRAARGGK